MGAFVRNDGCKCEYLDELVKDWNSKLCMLSYSAFASGFKKTLCYFMRTILEISNLLLPTENTIFEIDSYQQLQVEVYAMKKNGSYYLYQLETRYGGLTIPISHEHAEVEYNNSRRITTELTSLITYQQMAVDELAIKKIKLVIKKRITCTKNVMEYLKDNMSKRLLQLSTKKGVSNWLTMLLIAEYGFELSKQHFCDSISLKYR